MEQEGGPKGRGGSEVELVPFISRKILDLSTTPALCATPPVPGGAELGAFSSGSIRSLRML